LVELEGAALTCSGCECGICTRSLQCSTEYDPSLLQCRRIQSFAEPDCHCYDQLHGRSTHRLSRSVSLCPHVYFLPLLAPLNPAAPSFTEPFHFDVDTALVNLSTPTCNATLQAAALAFFELGSQQQQTTPAEAAAAAAEGIPASSSIGEASGGGGGRKSLTRKQQQEQEGGVVVDQSFSPQLASCSFVWYATLTDAPTVSGCSCCCCCNGCCRLLDHLCMSYDLSSIDTRNSSHRSTTTYNSSSSSSRACHDAVKPHVSYPLLTKPCCCSSQL